MSKAKSWMKLELRKASNLRKEVDEAIRSLSSAIQCGDQEKIDDFRTAFSERIDELEEFYLQHDDDERAVLFEKQRLRLRRALQATNQAAAAILREASHHKADENAKVKSNRALEPNALRPGAVIQDHEAERDSVNLGRNFGHEQPGQEKMPSAPHTLEVAKKETKKNSTTSTLQEPPAKKVPSTSGRSTSKPVKTGVKPGTSKNSSSKMGKTSSKKKRVTPLYAWEKDENEDVPVNRTPIETSYGIFLPSTNVMGYYEQQHVLPVSQQYVDFRIILSEAEMQKLVSMQRKAQTTKQNKSAQPYSESEFLFSSMPYVDGQRIEKSLYRDGCLK